MILALKRTMLYPGIFPRRCNTSGMPSLLRRYDRKRRNSSLGLDLPSAWWKSFLQVLQQQSCQQHEEVLAIRQIMKDKRWWGQRDPPKGVSGHAWKWFILCYWLSFQTFIPKLAILNIRRHIWETKEEDDRFYTCTRCFFLLLHSALNPFNYVVNGQWFVTDWTLLGNF